MVNGARFLTRGCRRRDCARSVAVRRWSARSGGGRGNGRCGRVGVWVEHADGREEKIAAIGIRLKKWVSFHGISINVDPDLSHFGGIVPCGISEHGVTSLNALGQDASLQNVDKALRKNFEKIFGPVAD